MSAIKSAFNMLINMQGRQMTVRRHGTAYVATVKAAPSNYFRNLEVVNSVVSKGREFVISKDELTTALYPTPKRGDRLEDPELGIMTMTDVRDLVDLGGAIIGYRVRTD